MDSFEETVTVSITCPECKEKHTLNVPYEGYQRWKCGGLIQRALPEMHYADREMLISGICPKCWDKLFKEEE